LIGCPTDRPSGRGHAISFFTRLLFAIYFLETGLLLVVAPWTAWWTRNFAADLWPWLQTLMAFSVTRVGVVALGAVTFGAGLSEFWHLFIRRPLDEGAHPPDLSSPQP
jgi:hypothetical protein